LNNDHSNEVYERASHNVAVFDHEYRHILQGTNNQSSSWRQRQMSITKLNPIRPYPTLPTQLIHPDNNSSTNNINYPASFFPPYAHSGIVPYSIHHDRILLHESTSIARMKKSATLARQLLDYIVHPANSRPGHTTDQLNTVLHHATLCHSAYPSPLNYSGFPKSVCTSLNEVVCHGIPDSRTLRVGDVLSCDVSVYLDGVHGDNCGTVVVGDVDDDWYNDFSVENWRGGGGGGGGGGGSCGEKKHADLLSWDGYSDWMAASSSSVVAGGDHHPMKYDQSSLVAAAATTSTQSSSMQPKRDWPTFSIPQKTNFASIEEEERIVTARRLVQAALESRDEGVAACKPGGCLSDIGAAIHAVADAYG
jgi:methionine aminopeptidase